MYTKLLKASKVAKKLPSTIYICLSFKVIEITFFWELNKERPYDYVMYVSPAADLGEECRVWFIGVEVEQETSAPPPKKNPGSAPVLSPFALFLEQMMFICRNIQST